MPSMAEGRRRKALVVLGTLLGAGPGGVWAQSLELRPDQPRALVGDEVSLTVHVRLRPGQELLDLTPRNLLPPPSGMRVLGIDSLRPAGEGQFSGRVRMVFFRVGPQPIPTFSLLYRPGPGELPDTLVHAPVAMAIGSILPAGNPELKDIRPLQIIGGPAWGPALLLALGLGAGFFYLWVRGRRATGATPGSAAAVPIEAGPFDLALRQLAAIEQRAIASGNGAVPLYEDVAEALRGCLLSAGALRHAGLTTAETAAALPPTLGHQGGRERLSLLLADADLVKFARVRPDLPAALQHLEQARQLLTAWQHSRAPEIEPPPGGVVESPR